MQNAAKYSVTLQIVLHLFFLNIINDADSLLRSLSLLYFKAQYKVIQMKILTKLLINIF